MMTSPVRLARFSLLMAFASAVATAETAAADLPYGQTRDFLVRYTRVLELTSDDGQQRVAICPEYQGRVMTSTCNGLDGPSFGWINHAFIEAGQANEHFNNYGGEDRFWLGPEAGQFGLWFAPGEQQILEHWLTPPALNDGAFQVASRETQPLYRLGRRIRFQNAAKTLFHLDVSRLVRLHGRASFEKRFGAAAAAALGQDGLKFVGFGTENTITNRGRAWDEDTGLVAIWILGMFPPGDRTAIIVPYRPGAEQELGPVVNADYFGKLPPERLQITPEAILFRGDGQFRAKLGTSQRRARPVAGSVDFDRNVLTLVWFSMPEDPTSHRYVNNTWKLPQEEPYAGDVFNSYNDGPPEPGAKALGGFFELETMSPTSELTNGQSLSHEHVTFHVQGESSALARVAKAALGVDLADVRRRMFGD